MTKAYEFPASTEVVALRCTEAELDASFLHLYKDGDLEPVITVSGYLSEFIESNYNNLFYLVRSLNDSQIKQYAKVVITLGELRNTREENSVIQTIFDNSNEKVDINNMTPILPATKITENLFYPVFTIIDNQLLEIVTLRGKRSDLVSGLNPKYRNNVFYLFSDLSKEERKKYKDVVVTFNEAMIQINDETAKLIKK